MVPSLIGELGIGGNPHALYGTETEKARLGTAHFGLGQTDEYPGGTIRSAVHVDGVIRNARVEVDGVAVIADGRLVFQRRSAKGAVYEYSWRRESRSDVLFEPVRVGPKTMKNRFCRVPHCTGLGTDFPYSQAALRRVKAEGGWAVVDSEYCSIHPESDDRPTIGARLWDQDDVRNMSLMCDEIHAHDALAGVELDDGGALGRTTTRETCHAGSKYPDPELKRSRWRSIAVGADKTEIRELQRMLSPPRSAHAPLGRTSSTSMGARSERSRSSSSWASSTSEPTSVVDLSRAGLGFWLETIELVKEAVGDDCAITARYCSSTRSTAPQTEFAYDQRKA